MHMTMSQGHPWSLWDSLNITTTGFPGRGSPPALIRDNEFEKAGDRNPAPFEIWLP